MGGPLHSDPFYWLEKLRKWQEKYNPLGRLVSWSELDANHINPKSEMQLAGYPDACFLFRNPENGPEEAHLPLNQSSLDRAWYELLKALELRLANRKEVFADGSPVILVDPSSNSTTEFPLHSLRVSLVTALALDGHVPFPVLQKVTGHSRLVMLLYYTNPEEIRLLSEIEEGAKRLDSGKEKSIVAFLRGGEFRKLTERAIFRDPEAFACVVAEHPAARNPAGWMPMHHGMCLVGGNTSPIEDNKQIGGCYNGGPNLGTASNPRHGPVPGGARNCVRCRWFVTEPYYLTALVAHLNNILYHFNEAQNKCVALDRLVGELRALRSSAEREGVEFERLQELKDAQRQFETAMVRFSNLAEDARDCTWFIQRCVEHQNRTAEGAASGALIARGTPHEFKVMFDEVDSELLQLSGVCEAVEYFPDIEPGKAILRRSQLLDAALMREGLPPMFLQLTEAEQLRAANSFMRKLAVTFNPNNPALGKREVIALMDAGESLSNNCGIDMAAVLNDASRSESGGRTGRFSLDDGGRRGQRHHNGTTRVVRGAYAKVHPQTKGKEP
jgi:hypothetical protein